MPLMLFIGQSNQHFQLDCNKQDKGTEVILKLITKI